MNIKEIIKDIPSKHIYHKEKAGVIICGDSLEILPMMAGGCVNLVVTDPPFDNSLSGSGVSGYRKYLDGIKKFTGFNTQVLEATKRLMDGYNGYWFFNIKQLFQYTDFIRENGYNYLILTWHKRNPTPLLSNNYLPDTEYIFFIREKGIYFKATYKTGARYIVTNVWKNNYAHPSAKPAGILHNYILNSSKENDIILDCFLGSGATAVAAKELGRKFIGIELNERYCAIAVERLHQGVLSF